MRPNVYLAILNSACVLTAHGTSEFVWVLDFIHLWAQLIERRIFPVNLDLKTRAGREGMGGYIEQRRIYFTDRENSVLFAEIVYLLSPKNFFSRSVISKNQR